MRAASLLTIGLVLAACGGGEATTTTAANGAGAASATTATSTTSAVAATPAPTTTVAEEPVGGEECLVGLWELDSEGFIAAIAEAFQDDPELGGTTIEFVGGTNVTELEASGTFWNDRDDWSFRFTTAEGAIRTTINGIDQGIYTVEGDQITISDVDGAAVVKLQAEVEGELVDIPFGSTGISQTDVWLGTGTYTCSGDSLTLMTDEGVTAAFIRVG